MVFAELPRDDCSPQARVLTDPRRARALGLIDARDLARVADRVITDDGHDGATYLLTGLEVMPRHEVAKTLSHAVGCRVRYLDLPAPAYHRAYAWQVSIDGSRRLSSQNMQMWWRSAMSSPRPKRWSDSRVNARDLAAFASEMRDILASR